MKGIRYGITSFIYRHNLFFFFSKFFPIEHVDVLVGGDNLSSHCSNINLRESRMLWEIDSKDSLGFHPRGCTNVVAGPDNNMVNLEKTFTRQYYRAERRNKQNGPKWCKAPKDGGHKPYERRAHYMNWISRARKEFLLNHQKEIWKRHQECGFILVIDGCYRWLGNSQASFSGW